MMPNTLIKSSTISLVVLIASMSLFAKKVARLMKLAHFKAVVISATVCLLAATEATVNQRGMVSSPWSHRKVFITSTHQ
jgi:hypothetical protein